ncbi:hypothetical protein RQP46_009990 [Phenoliferia psychrophenolica]
MDVQRKKIKTLQGILFRGGEDSIDPVYSPTNIVANLSLLHSRSKIHHLRTTPNYAYLVLLKRRPRRDRLVQPFLHVQHAIGSSGATNARVDEKVSDSAEYVFGRKLSPLELKWIENRSSEDGMWTYLTCLASVRQVNEMAQVIREREGTIARPADEAKSFERGPGGKFTSSKKRSGGRKGRR